MEIEGETLATGQYLSFGAVEPGYTGNDDGYEVEGEEDLRQSQPQAIFDESTIDPNLDNPTPPVEKPSTKRSRSPDGTASTQAREKTKRIRTSNTGVLNDIGTSITSIAESFASRTQQQKASESSPIDNATDAILCDPLLSDNGQALMLDIIQKPGKAKTYLAIQTKTQVRRPWLKRQIEEAGGKVEECITNENEA